MKICYYQHCLLSRIEYRQYRDRFEDYLLGQKKPEEGQIYGSWNAVNIRTNMKIIIQNK